MYVIQLAALSGLDVIATTSPKNFDLLKSYGAKHLLDYRSPTIVEEIQKLTDGKLEYIFDCYSAGGSVETTVKTLSPSGGHIVTVLPYDASKLDPKVKLHALALFKVTGKTFTFAGTQYTPRPEEKAWYEDTATGLLSTLNLEGKLKPNPVKVVGGLESVSEGFKYMLDGKVSAEKLVFEVVKE
jgi:NADPH:quinone reductase-like Zn-dependent oxidoreductase